MFSSFIPSCRRTAKRMPRNLCLRFAYQGHHFGSNRKKNGITKKKEGIGSGWRRKSVVVEVFPTHAILIHEREKERKKKRKWKRRKWDKGMMEQKSLRLSFFIRLVQSSFNEAAQWWHKEFASQQGEKKKSRTERYPVHPDIIKQNIFARKGKKICWRIF